MSKYRSFALTISTAEPVEGDGQKKLYEWLKKQPYCYAIIEGGEGKEQDRHLHAQCWYDTPREKGTLNKPLKRIIESQFPESDPKIAIKIKIAYNDDYLEKYMKKDITELLLDKAPQAETRGDFYPSEEEQEKVQKEANAVDHRFNRLEDLFCEWIQGKDEPSGFFEQKVVVARFLADMMYVSKKIKVITDKKAKTQLCNSLTRYIHNIGCIDDFLTEEEWKQYEDLFENKMI